MSDLKNAYAKIGASASRMTPNCVTCEWKTKWKATQLMSSISNFAVFLNYLSDGLWSLNEYSYRSGHDLISVLRYARIATQGILHYYGAVSFNSFHNKGHCTRNVVINSSGNRRWPMAIKRRGTAYSLNIGLLGEKRFHRKLISLIVNSAMSIVDNVI